MIKTILDLLLAILDYFKEKRQDKRVKEQYIQEQKLKNKEIANNGTIKDLINKVNNNS
jgi:hypothetical protein